MRIETLHVENFKAIVHLHLVSLENMVVIAGANGSGKSCVFDAIRLLKATHGGYASAHEYQRFFSEFHINPEKKEERARIMNDKRMPMVIEAAFRLSSDEITYITNNAETIILDELTRAKIREEHSYPDVSTTPFLPSVRQELGNTAKSHSLDIILSLDSDIHLARLSVDTTLELSLATTPALLFIFRRFDPENIGMIDYHGANRFYQRERLGGVNVNVEESQQRFAQHSLFDIQNKYTNIKSELASSYVRELIASSIGVYPTSDFGMIETLKEMFTLFFPGKTFSGPRALETGTLSFPIEIEGGAEHDIDDLSSGEKELVYGYLRLRNSSPKHSILLLDEPELYLNPRLIRGLPDFYKRHLGVALNNQIWLVTHSDAFLREAVGRQGFSVFHMTPPTAVDRTQNQATTLSAGSELEKTILAMVGDLASYRPGAKIVIFEGDTGTEFDISLVSRLFPSIVENLTPLSGSNRRAVVRLYEMLKAAITAANLPMRIYAIVDRDTTPIEEPVYPLDAGKKWA